MYLRKLERKLRTVLQYPVDVCETTNEYVFSLPDIHEVSAYPELQSMGARAKYDRIQKVTTFYVTKPVWYLPMLRKWMECYYVVITLVLVLVVLSYLSYLVYANQTH
jgi:hypothetical protein